jgi:hypothetical protein
VKRALSSAATVGIALSFSFFACSKADEGGDPDTSPIAWVSPSPDAEVHVDDVLQLAVKVNDARATAVSFVVDGNPLATCDSAAPGSDCRTDDLFRTTTTFTNAGPHHLVASFTADGDERSAAIDLEVLAKEAPSPPPDVDAGVVTPPDRGFLDPDKPLHNVFGGVSWSVSGQRVLVEAPPSGSVSAVAACMLTYGASIIKHADASSVSRASVVATAITESDCTDPAGSSDGLSSGPMQVTGSTCASVAGGGITSAACKAKMFSSADFSFEIGAKYMGSAYQVKQHDHDPPKIGAAYNAGSVRQSSANRWHMVVTGNHIERFVAAYNAYRDWEATTSTMKASLEISIAGRAANFWNGEHVDHAADLPAASREGQVFFVGDWATRAGAFVAFRNGHWENDFAAP